MFISFFRGVILCLSVKGPYKVINILLRLKRRYINIFHARCVLSLKLFVSHNYVYMAYYYPDNCSIFTNCNY